MAVLQTTPDASWRFCLAAVLGSIGGMRIWQAIFRLGAPVYDWLTDNDTWRRHAAQMADCLPVGPGGIVLDLGCGPGGTTLALAQQLPQATVIGVDLAGSMLHRALRADRAKRCGWVQADAAALPFADGSIDAITGHSFLYLLPDRQAVLTELRRVLRPGGIVAFLEPSRQPATLDARGVAAIYRKAGPRAALTMALWRVAARTNRAFPPGELSTTFAAAGFDAIEEKAAFAGLGRVVTGTLSRDPDAKRRSA